MFQPGLITVPNLIEFKSIGSSDLGYITVAEYQNSIPFEIKRVYWTYYTPHEVIRGGHAHKALKQIIVAVSGSIEFNIENHSGEKFFFKLEHPKHGLYIPEKCWRTIQFSHNAVLLCLASLEFSADDYIRDYNDFKKLNS